MTRITCGAAAFVLAAGAIFGQSTAQISGTIRDPTGGAVPNAEVKAIQTATGVSRTVTSGANGAYTLANLPLGPYRIEVSKEGFSKAVESDITLQVDSNPTVDVALKVGTVNEAVTVEANAAMVETHSTGVGQVVENQRVAEMPLNGRNPWSWWC
jgi:Carboxypeptidase regulatory-like domain